MTNIVTPQTIKAVSAVCTLAKTVLNDNSNTVKLLDAGASGSVIYGVKALARATVTATGLHLYRVSGGSYFLIDTVLMAAWTYATTTAQAKSDFGYSGSNPLRLAVGDSLYCAITVALAGGVVFDCQYENI